MDNQQNTLEISLKILLRGINHLVDSLISTTIIIILYIVLTATVFNDSSFTGISEYLYYLVLYGIAKFLYYFVSEAIFAKTPGKFITQTQVVTELVARPHIGALFVRTLCRAIPFNEFSVFALKGRTFHDTISHTDVTLSKLVPEYLRLPKVPNVVFTIFSYVLILPIFGVLVWAFTTNLVSGESISLPKNMPQGLQLTSIATATFNETDYTVMKFSGEGREITATWIIAGFDYDPDNECNYMRPTHLPDFGYEEISNNLICNQLSINTNRESNQWRSLYKIEAPANLAQTFGDNLPDYYMSDPPHRFNIKVTKGSVSEEEIMQMYNDGFTETNYKAIQTSLEQ